MLASSVEGLLVTQLLLVIALMLLGLLRVLAVPHLEAIWISQVSVALSLLILVRVLTMEG